MIAAVSVQRWVLLIRGQCRTRTAILSGMPGPVALVGSGEFLPAMRELDAGLLAATGRSRPRVVVVPTAAIPDGLAVFERWARLGVEHFSSLGAEVEPVLVRDRADAEDAAFCQAVGEADLIYLSGGKPGYLSGTVGGSRLEHAIWSAHARGAVLAGCSAGAMALAERHFEFRRGKLIWPVRWREGFGLVPNVSVLPHYDAFPEPLSLLLALQAPRGSTVIGLDEETAIVGRDGSWQVHGRSRVTVWRGRRRERFRAGDVFRV